jgi:hypothetical protein
MKVNLHLHSRYSDGTLWPGQIIERAKKIGLDQVSLTDHDCMEGVNTFLLCARDAGMEALAGVEIDCEAEDIGYNSELLGYFPGGSWRHTREFCRKRMAFREERIKKLILAAARHYKSDLTFGELKIHKIGNRAPVAKNLLLSYSKPDLFQYLKFKKAIRPDTVYAAFKNTDFMHDIKDPKPSVREVIDIILSDNGIPALPHPGLIFSQDPGRMKTEGPDIFKWFMNEGILAVECNYYAEKKGDHTEELNRLVQEFARELGLGITWGSDCHGPGHESDTMENFWGTERFPFPINRNSES